MVNKFTPVCFDDKQKAVIQKVTSSTSFQHKDWNNEELSAELQQIRSYIRSHYRTEQKAKCAYCRKDVSMRSALNCHVEHIAPKSVYKDYMFYPRNLCVACADCNEIKGEIDTIEPLKSGLTRKNYPKAASQFKIVHPHFDNYDDHIGIFYGKYFIDKTPKGHFTIAACKLNQRLKDYGVYEPDDMVILATELSEARANGNEIMAKLIIEKMRQLL